MFENKTLGIIVIVLLAISLIIFIDDADAQSALKAGCCAGECLGNTDSKEGFTRPANSYSCSIKICQGAERWWCRSGCELNGKNCGNVCEVNLGQCSGQTCENNVCVGDVPAASETPSNEAGTGASDGGESQSLSDQTTQQQTNQQVPESLQNIFNDVDYLGLSSINVMIQNSRFNFLEKVVLTSAVGTGRVTPVILNEAQKQGISAEELEQILNSFKNTYREQVIASQTPSRSEIDCSSNPNNCVNIRAAGGRCGNLRFGERCEMSWEIEVEDNAMIYTRIPFEVAFSYKSNNINRQSKINSVLNVIGEVAGTADLTMTTSSTVLDITGRVAQAETVRIGNYECALKPNPNVCCIAPYTASIQDPNKCVFGIPGIAKPAVREATKEDILRLIAEKMQQYLNAPQDEKEPLKKELIELDSRLRNQ